VRYIRVHHVIQATVSEGLAQSPYVARFQPVTLRSKGTDSTNSPLRPQVTIPIRERVECLLSWTQEFLDADVCKGRGSYKRTWKRKTGIFVDVFFCFPVFFASLLRLFT